MCYHVRHAYSIAIHNMYKFVFVLTDDLQKIICSVKFTWLMYSTKSKFLYQKSKSDLALQIPFSFTIKTEAERRAKVDTLLTVL